MSTLKERLKKANTNRYATELVDSAIFNKTSLFTTEYPLLNIAFSGMPDGGIRSGLTTIAGPSKSFKTQYLLLLAREYQKTYPDCMILFYDSEMGSAKKDFELHGIGMQNVMHIPVTNLEELKFSMMELLPAMERGDKAIVLVDSIGNLSSKKEFDDAINQNSAADMSRAKYLKGFYRIITPLLSLLDIPMLQIAHVYSEQGMFPKTILGGGSGIYLSSDNIWFISRRVVKDGRETTGFIFNIKIEKSRYLREQITLPFEVSYDKDVFVRKDTGIFDLLVAAGVITSPTKGYYSLDGIAKRRRSDFKEAEVLALAKTVKFKEWCANNIMLGGKPVSSDILTEVVE